MSKKQKIDLKQLTRVLHDCNWVIKILVHQCIFSYKTFQVGTFALAPTLLIVQSVSHPRMKQRNQCRKYNEEYNR